MTARSAIARWQRAMTAVLATAALVVLLAGQLPPAAAAEAGMGPMSTATARQFTRCFADCEANSSRPPSWPR